VANLPLDESAKTSLSKRDAPRNAETTKSQMNSPPPPTKHAQYTTYDPTHPTTHSHEARPAAGASLLNRNQNASPDLVRRTPVQCRRAPRGAAPLSLLILLLLLTVARLSADP